MFPLLVINLVKKMKGLLACLYLKKMTSVFIYLKKCQQLVIEGVVGGGYRGDIAIDDITTKPGQCPTGRLAV